MPRERAEEHYGEHEDKPFYDDLVDFITSGPVVPMVWEGQDATRQVRQMIGETDPLEAEPGTIRATTRSISVGTSFTPPTTRTRAQTNARSRSTSTTTN